MYKEIAFHSEYISVLVTCLQDVHGAARFRCSWQANDPTTINDSSGKTSWHSVSVFFREISKSSQFSWPKNIEDTHLSLEQSANEHCQIDPQNLGSTTVFRFVLDCLLAADSECETVASLIVPLSRGYIVRSDIIPLRLLDCPLVRSVTSFAKPLQFFDGELIGAENLQQLPQIFTAAVGAMILKRVDSTDTETLLISLDDELRKRLSFPWLSTQTLKRQTLAIVCGGVRGPDAGLGRSMYAAAEALGIDMVVIDNPEHWTNQPCYSHWYKAFIPLKLPLQIDAGFVSRIVDTVRSLQGQIDGLVTFRERYRVSVAQAALQLGFSTEPPWAYDIATDKFKTSLCAGHHAFQASTVEQASSIVQEHRLRFPLIIKPCTGFLSEGVSKIDDLAQLEAGVQAIDADRHGRRFVIEKYCDGPEVDANLALCDGELAFFEASDDFPKSADGNGRDTVNSFFEFANVLPSGLPEQELAVLRDSLHQSLLRMGFRNGFYHLEARVENSSMEYATKNNVVDLFERSSPSKEAPSAWLIEVNPRPPGVQALTAVKHTYGVEYSGIGLLFAVNDLPRVRQLLHSFQQGAQYWCEMVFIPVDKGGVYESGNVCEELCERRPDLADHFSEFHCFLKRGDRVADPVTGMHAWVAYFNVFSRESRAHLLEIAECVRREVRFSIV